MTKNERIIITNRTDLPMKTILKMAANIVAEGRVSDEGKSYCYASSFRPMGVVCFADVNKASDTLTFQMDGKRKEQEPRIVFGR